MPVTDEDIIRDLMRRYTDDAYPAASIATGVAARQRQRDRRRRAVSVAAIGAVFAIAAGVVAATAVPGRTAGPAVKLTAAQRVLYQLSSAAARQPPALGRYVVFSEKEDGNLDTSVIDSLTGDMWFYQKGSSGAGSVAHPSATAAEFAAMPLDPAGLRAALIAQYAQTGQQDQKPVSTLRKPHLVPGYTKPPEGADDKVFEQATELLWNPLVPPTLRSALFRVLAATPGVTVNPAARDTAGQPGVEISRTDSVSKVVYAAYEARDTGAVLELTRTYPPNAGLGPASDPNSTYVGYDLALSITRTNTIPPDPYAS